MSVPGLSWRLKNIGVQLRCPRAVPCGAYWIGAVARVAHDNQWDDNLATISTPQGPPKVSTASVTGSWNASHTAETIERSCKFMTCQRGIRAVTRHTGAQVGNPWEAGICTEDRSRTIWRRIEMHDGRNAWPQLLDASWVTFATPAAPGPVMQTAVRRTVRPGRAPSARKRCLRNRASFQGDRVHSVTWILRTLNNDAGARVQDIQRAVEVPRNGAAHSPRHFREQRRSMQRPRPMKHDAANVIGLDNATRRAE
ncbi:hypothetical protein Tc00.1047053510657.210 [Trypanosoma cruzi]|uniref:Uncharacterized protein n=1 Tax=Trypanosoma cruzi (strain CL Brener) TaxID=353153 RepID=Q4DS20_TRYCC|nr:hypothetical protein Tc00.1047053510657.210 [Trypanosoma cruzi]EAN95337.1 hypothetical protein Tc00.1047053510657.210 [Trypanosoma cruzi]|eukprot:XP_817188.1 hypothetical protein [Trypanosoma cruzi strain CL Brener]